MSEQDSRKEKSCGVIHKGFDDALAHACEGLARGEKLLLSKPFWGTRGGNLANVGKVIGWQSPDGRKRWRLDFDTSKEVHINEEDFTGSQPRKIFHRINISLAWAITYWNKWTSRYDKPPHVIEAEREIDRLRKQRFK